jgi:hypothetical protein
MWFFEHKAKEDWRFDKSYLMVYAYQEYMLKAKHQAHMPDYLISDL